MEKHSIFFLIIDTLNNYFGTKKAHPSTRAADAEGPVRSLPCLRELILQAKLLALGDETKFQCRP